MTSKDDGTPTAADDAPAEPELDGGRLHRRRASHLYGLIISGSVLASAPTDLGLAHIALAVLATLVVYWSAETYAHWIAARTVHGRPLTRHEERVVVADGWPLVAASGAPVGVLLVEQLLGVEVSRGVTVALTVNLALLLIVGWRMSRAGGLHGWRHVGATLITGLLGVAMIGLKLALH
ncbi:hypothetical protein [Cellulomonas alba]|uniref:Integral membrane protein n=1 Tax=Cellulomonas alba TaxID=3053467 RepID=A0ABT7SJD9_9CELL|nr:hypothetical protein [Cellulomonas alba]MDM7856293.1 hypothetical protein [Cellulomonas alba]